MRAVLAACILIGGCALLQPPAPKPEAAPLRAGEILSAQAAKEAVSIGKSTKADVRAALGQALVVDFDSGYEVWVYRERPKEKADKADKAPPPAAEFVLLFSPSGILTKTRIR